MSRDIILRIWLSDKQQYVYMDNLYLVDTNDCWDDIFYSIEAVQTDETMPKTTGYVNDDFSSMSSNYVMEEYLGVDGWYEGDILKYHCQNYEYVGEIIFTEGAFMFKDVKNGDLAHLSYVKQYGAYKIGNIHENRDLL